VTQLTLVSPESDYRFGQEEPMSNALPGRAISQAEIDQRSREARRQLEEIEARLVSGIPAIGWWGSLRLRRLIMRIYRRSEPVADHCVRN
jgi:hypothetical protein